MLRIENGRASRRYPNASAAILWSTWSGCTKLKPHGVLNFFRLVMGRNGSLDFNFNFFFRATGRRFARCMGAPRSIRPPMGPKEGGLRHPSPRPIKRREAPHLRLFKRAVNARAVNTESFGDLSGAPLPCAFIWRTCAASIEAGRPL